MAKAGGPRLVVRNTFLEVFDDSAPGGDAEPAKGRPRAQTDITDAKLPRKVSYPVNPTEEEPLDGCGTQAAVGYNPVHVGGFVEDQASGRFPGAGSHLMSTPNPLGPPGAMGMPPFPGFPGPFPAPWAYAAMGPAGPFSGLPGMPWGYPAAPFGAAGAAAAAAPAQQPRAAGRRNQGEKGKKGGSQIHQNNAGSGGGNNTRGVFSPQQQPQKQPQLSAGASTGPTGGVQRQSPATCPTSIGGAEEGTASAAAERPLQGTETTVMLRNIPNRYTQSMLLQLLDEYKFQPVYDFVYLPMDFRNGVNLGYAFVNLLTHEDALRLMETFQGFSKWFFDSAKVCEVSWAHPHQGLHEHVERYRNSPVMHPTMPEEYKPMVFQACERIPFPPPTKAIRAPKLRPVQDKTNAAAAPLQPTQE